MFVPTPDTTPPSAFTSRTKSPQHAQSSAKVNSRMDRSWLATFSPAKKHCLSPRRECPVHLIHRPYESRQRVDNQMTSRAVSHAGFPRLTNISSEQDLKRKLDKENL